MTPTVRFVCRAALVALLLPLTTAASCDGGDRAQSGLCPEGERCSGETPGGLHFIGPLIAEGVFDPRDVKTTAVGGTQDVRLEIVGDDGERIPFVAPHLATLDGTHLAIERQHEDALVLRGVAAGDDYLRVIDPQTKQLFDRVRVAAAPLASAKMFESLIMSFDADRDRTAPPVYAPGSIAYVGLVADGGGALVDTSARLAGAGVAQFGWDRFVVGGVAPGMHAVTVTAGDHAPIVVPFEVAQPDRLELHGALRVDVLRRGTKELVCFVARQGDRMVEAALEYGTGDAHLEPLRYAGCTSITAEELGPVVIHVWGAGLSATFELEAVDEDAPRVVATPDAQRGHTAGERAVLIGE